MNARRLFISVAAAVIVLAASVQAGPRAYLRNNVLIEGDTVKLGDVFDGAGKMAERVIAHAPPAGRTLVLEADWLYRVARAYKVSWRPTSRLDRSVVERRSRIIETDQIHEALTKALKEKYADLDEIEMELDSRALRLFLPFKMPGEIRTQSISYDTRSRRFTARVFAPDDRPGAVRAVITGSAFPMTQIPTLVRRLNRNDIIGNRDIEWKTVRLDTVDSRTITDLETLIGQSPRRQIASDRAIRDDEVQPPILVTRGKQVTIALTTPLLQLTALGKALQNGAKGDVVRVQNSNSGKIISAVVIGDKRVAVSTLNNIALQ